MRLEGVIKRVSLARESKRKHDLPYDSFFDKLYSASGLVDFVEMGKADREVRQEARKYFVINCASCMEIYFKRMAQKFIDAGWVNINIREILRHDNISLADLMEINKRKLSLGEIVSVSHPLQEPASINSFFSKILGVKDFLKEVETVEVGVSKGNKYVLGEEYPDFRAKIEELVRLRHLIVHHEGFKGVLGFKRLVRMGVRVGAFIAAADEYLMARIPEG